MILRIILLVVRDALRSSLSKRSLKVKSMSKAKGDKSSKRKRGEATKKGNGKKAATVKKARGPKSHLEPSKGKVDADTIKSAREMLDDDDDDEAESDDDIEAERRPERMGTSSSSGKTAFLLNLDEKGISR